MLNEHFRYVIPAALAALVTAAPAPAQPEPADAPETITAPDARAPARDPSRPEAADETTGDEAPEIFVPSEEISGDTVVSFPVDI